jgi:hypothetical protein
MMDVSDISEINKFLTEEGSHTKLNTLMLTSPWLG